MVNNFGKIIRIFTAITKESFEYDGTRYEPKPLVVHPSIANGLVCPPGCGACCKKTSLHFNWFDLTPVYPAVDYPDLQNHATGWIDSYGGNISLDVDFQNNNQADNCRWLNQNGRCQLHGMHPFICDFEPIQVKLGNSINYNEIRTARFSKRALIRRADGDHGAKCEFTGPTEQSVSETVRKFVRLEHWTKHFDLRNNWIPEIMDYLLSGKWREGPLVLPEDFTLPPRAFKYPGRDLLKRLVGEERYTRGQLLEKLIQAHPEVPKSYYETLLSDCKNPAYNRFHRLVVEEQGIYLWKRLEEGEQDLSNEEQAIGELIDEGAWTKDDIIEEVVRRFPETGRSAISQLVSDAADDARNWMDDDVVINPDGTWRLWSRWRDELDPDDDDYEA